VDDVQGAGIRLSIAALERFLQKVQTRQVQLSEAIA
jgi:hypothetical protein